MKHLSIIPQRQDRDCGISSLAMLLRMPYEDIYVAVCQVDPKASKNGLGLNDLQAIAKLCGVTLIRRRSYDLDTDEGILSVRSAKHWHYVVLCNGAIVDPDAGRIFFDADDYLTEHNARACTLLVAA